MLIKMAFRNIFRNKRRTFLTGCMMTGGFVFISASLALMDGSYGSIIKIFTRQYTGQVQIANREYIDNPSIQKSIGEYKELMEELQQRSEVKSVAPRIYGESLVYLNNKTFGAQIVGIDPLKEKKASGYDLRILEGKAFAKGSSYQAIVGKTVAKILNAKIGDELVLISQGADGSIANDLFKIQGIIGTEQEGRDDYRIYLPLSSADEFFSLYGRVHEISIQLVNLKEAKHFAKKLVLKNKKLQVRPWQEVEDNFYRTMQADQKGNDVSVFILMLMVGTGILNTILMSALERTREFGVLKALGTLPRRLFSLILIEGVLLSLISCVIGLFISWGLNSYLSVHGISFEEPISFAGMMISEFNSEVTFSSFFYPALIVVSTTLIACLYPGIKSSRINVAPALREF